MSRFGITDRPPVALVTGASSGIGQAIARSLAEQGYRLGICARRGDRLEQLQTELTAQGAEVLAQSADLRQEADILAVFDVLRQRWGGVDVLVNNAGLGHNSPLMSGEADAWREMLDVNVLALCICTREAIQDMRQRGDRGHIIHISSHRVIVFLVLVESMPRASLQCEPLPRGCAKNCGPLTVVFASRPLVQALPKPNLLRNTIMMLRKRRKSIPGFQCYRQRTLPKPLCTFWSSRNTFKFKTFCCALPTKPPSRFNRFWCIALHLELRPLTLIPKTLYQSLFSAGAASTGAEVTLSALTSRA